jgi:hypothetical protein
LTGFPLAKQIQIWTVKYSNFDHGLAFLDRGRQVCPKKQYLSTVRRRIEEDGSTIGA